MGLRAFDLRARKGLPLPWYQSSLASSVGVVDYTTGALVCVNVNCLFKVSLSVTDFEPEVLRSSSPLHCVKRLSLTSKCSKASTCSALSALSLFSIGSFSCRPQTSIWLLMSCSFPQTMCSFRHRCARSRFCFILNVLLCSTSTISVRVVRYCSHSAEFLALQLRSLLATMC